MNKITDITAAVFDVPEDVRDAVTYTCDKWSIDPDSKLAGIITNFMVGILDVAEEEREALTQLSEATGVKFSKVNIEEVKNIDPADYDDQEGIAEKMMAVLKQEARKLVLTSDYLTDVRNNLSDCKVDRSEDAKLQKDIYLAQRVAGTSVKRSMEIFKERTSFQSEYTLSHTPGPFLTGTVHKIMERINPFLPPDKQMDM